MFKTSRPLFKPHPRIRPLENVQYPGSRVTEGGVELFTRLAVRISDRPRAAAAAAA
jgi:hypothetical protein